MHLHEHGCQRALRAIHVLLQITLHPLKDEVKLAGLVDDVFEAAVDSARPTITQKTWRITAFPHSLHDVGVTRQILEE